MSLATELSKLIRFINNLHKIISGPQFNMPIMIMTIELTSRPKLAVIMNKIKNKALIKVSTVEPNRDLSLKNLLVNKIFFNYRSLNSKLFFFRFY